MRLSSITRARPTTLTALLLTGVALGCGGRSDAPVIPTPPSPTDVSVTINLTTPNNDDGAILLTITGPSILGVSARPGLEVDESQVTTNGATTSTILLRGNLTSGAIGEVRVRSVDANATYTAQVRQVAARASGGYALRADLSAYALTMRP